MSSAELRFYAELNDFLPAERQQQAFTHRFEGRVSVKDMIESLGVPHTEIEVVLANGRSVDFTYLVKDGDHISVYPVFESLDITPLLRLRPEPLRHTCFVLDQHLGRLAAYLRLLGFDTLYRNDYDDEELARIAAEEGRILLTRDRGLLKRRQVTRGYCVRSTDSQEQLLETVRRFDLAGSLHPFTRCPHCNGRLAPVTKEEVQDRLPPHTREHYDDFRLCESCGQVYWQGAHHHKLAELIEQIAEADGK
jgi:uncharacterized protein with PIN domain